MESGSLMDAERPRRPDASASEPLWAQVLADLRERIRTGSFAESFPTDAVLVHEYSVSRQTVREAVRHLAAEGLVERRRRTGSRLRPAEFEQPLGSLYSLFREVEAHGVVQTSLVRSLERRRVVDVGERLGLTANDDLVYMERIRLAKGVPLALDRVWLPADLAAGILDADFSRTALYDELASRCSIAPVLAREQIRPVTPSPTEARLLGLAGRRPCFAIERTPWTDGGRALEWRVSLVRGDRYAFVAEWTGGARRESTRWAGSYRLAMAAPVGETAWLGEANPFAGYGALHDRLAATEAPVVELTFAEIETLVGALPAAARRRRWWTNNALHPQARAWLYAGWKATSPDLDAGVVHFRRVATLELPTEAPAGASSAG
jgi:GntR family transcriptional regulator